MLEGYDILCFAPSPWDDIWRNRQQIMSRLARANRILYVEPRRYRLSELRRGEVTWADVRHPRLEPVMKNLWLYRHPVYAPTSGRVVIDRPSRWLRMALIRQAMRWLGMRRPILWLYRPEQVEVIGQFNERLVLYHVVDEYTAFRYIDMAQRAKLRALEEQLLRQADLVIVTARALLESRKAFNSNIHWIPNAVDYTAFARVMDDPAPPPADIAALPSPVIGYVGHISVRLDLALLRQVALAQPDWSLALVGSIWEHDCADELATLSALPNVHFLGRKDVTQVPAYIKACQVCLIPYKQGEEARNINPLKLYEYLACGKPVVTTDLPELRGFRDVVYVATDAAGFVRAIEAAVSETSESLVRQRRQLAAVNDWEDRVTQLSQLIMAALDMRQAGCEMAGLPQQPEGVRSG